MLQLTLDFLGKQIGWTKPSERRTGRPSPPVDPHQPWSWKHGITVHFIRNLRARRYLLRLQPDGSARLVIPRRGSRTEAIQFLDRSEAWLLKQHELWQKRNQAQLPWTDGTRFLFRGEEVVLQMTSKGERVHLAFADQHFSLPHSLPDYRKKILAHLRLIAERELPKRTHELARIHGIAINRVTIRAQKTRWGSCSAKGTISLNWRLIQAPAHVVDYLIIHELMHRREMNHSARYWKLVAGACPDYRTAESWLKRTRLETISP